MKYRTEFKYICHQYDLDLLKEKIKAILRLDENAGKETYNIHSLYFDDYDNTSAFENDAGADDRHKWRIRYYDDNPDFMRLERKEKKNDLCLKKSCRIDKKQYEDILAGRYEEVLWKADDELLKKFCIACMNSMLRPKVIVDYERTAYVEPISNIRITFDRNICASLDVKSFAEGGYLKYPIQERDYHLLEVKFDDVLPEHIEKVLHSSKLQRNTFSKYYLSRVILERNLL